MIIVTLTAAIYFRKMGVLLKKKKTKKSQKRTAVHLKFGLKKHFVTREGVTTPKTTAVAPSVHLTKPVAFPSSIISEDIQNENRIVVHEIDSGSIQCTYDPHTTAAAPISTLRLDYTHIVGPRKLYENDNS